MFQFHEDRPVNGKLHSFCVPAGRLMLAGGLIPRMTTKRFPRHGVTVQNGRELIALSAVKPLEASLRDGSQIGIDVRGLKPTANINRPSGTRAPPTPQAWPLQRPSDKPRRPCAVEIGGR
jgi:hypothetical protein